MTSLWVVSKALQIPLDKRILQLDEIPYTVSYVIKKRVQIDNINELPKEKRPPENMIWEGTSEDLEDWMDKVFDRKKAKHLLPTDNLELIIKDDEFG